jgi:hypothetical protein
MLKLYSCLTPQEREKTLEILYGLKDKWEPRMGAGFPFYTLGAASYLDAGYEGEITYRVKAKKTNLLLKNNFQFLYDKVAETLEKSTGHKVVYEEIFALPGFHIFQQTEMFSYPIASEHFDLQFKELFWGYKDIAYDNPLSFTLAIKLPTEGSGLNYWDIFYSDVKELSKEKLEEIKNKKEIHYLPYEEGKMVVHSGLMLHQIAPLKKMNPADERITLQGHGLICENTLRVFW